MCVRLYELWNVENQLGEVSLGMMETSYLGDDVSFGILKLGDLGEVTVEFIEHCFNATFSLIF